MQQQKKSWHNRQFLDSSLFTKIRYVYNEKYKKRILPIATCRIAVTDQNNNFRNV